MHFDPTTEAFKRLDVKAGIVRRAMMNSTKEQIAAFWNQLDLLTIYHDWALEGLVLSLEELDSALNDRNITDIGKIPQSTVIRMHKEALSASRDIATRHNLVFSIELFNEFYDLLSTSINEKKESRYRNNTPLHRSYFHEICEPSKIKFEMEKLIDWMNNFEEAESLHTVEWVSVFHYRFMRIFPYADSVGKVGRTMANMILMRYGYLPAIIHATERQRYYEVIRHSQEELTSLFIESSISSFDAADRFFRSAVMAS